MVGERVETSLPTPFLDCSHWQNPESLLWCSEKTSSGRALTCPRTHTHAHTHNLPSLTLLYAEAQRGSSHPFAGYLSVGAKQDGATATLWDTTGCVVKREEYNGVTDGFSEELIIWNVFRMLPSPQYGSAVRLCKHVFNVFRFFPWTERCWGRVK